MKQKRRWPYSVDYEYKDEDRGVTRAFSVSADITPFPAEPSVGMGAGFEDFEFEIASLESITIHGEHDGEPDIELPVTDPDTCSAYCKWFQDYVENPENASRLGGYIYDELERLCIAEFQSAQEPYYGY